MKWSKAGMCFGTNFIQYIHQLCHERVERESESYRH